MPELHIKTTSFEGLMCQTLSDRPPAGSISFISMNTYAKALILGRPRREKHCPRAPLPEAPRFCRRCVPAPSSPLRHQIPCASELPRHRPPLPSEFSIPFESCFCIGTSSILRVKKSRDYFFDNPSFLPCQKPQKPLIFAFFGLL